MEQISTEGTTEYMDGGGFAHLQGGQSHERQREVRGGERTMIEAKLKHLEFLQGAINRMATTSFLLKGWAITIIGGLLALTFKEVDRRYLSISVVVLALFWLLDSMYLSHERNFVRLYDKVRTMREEAIDFSMDATPVGVRYGALRCALSKTILAFYAGLFAVHLLILWFI
ncbi:MAG: hypothetical protein ACLQDV_17155 [Candidatus Binataceae bacterium]